MKFESGTMENIVTPKGESTSEILAKYRSQGLKLEAQYHEAITDIRNACFQYLGVTSTQQLQKKLETPADGKYASLPMGFFYPFYFMGRKGKIQSDQGGKNKAIFIEKGLEEIEMEEEYGPIDPTPSELLFNEVCKQLKNDNIASAVWQSDGLYSNTQNSFIYTQHNGVYNRSNINGIGYALYRLYEEIFGMMSKEITPKLSLLKLYLKLGFIPDKVINPINGRVSSMDLESTLENYLKIGEEILPFPVLLKRAQ